MRETDIFLKIERFGTWRRINEMVERKESFFKESIPLVTIPAKQIAFIDQLVRLRKLKATTLIIILLSATAC